MLKTMYPINIVVLVGLSVLGICAYADTNCIRPDEADKDWPYILVKGLEKWGTNDTLFVGLSEDEIESSTPDRAYIAGDGCFYVYVDNNRNSIWVRLRATGFRSEVVKVDRLRSRRQNAPYIYRAEHSLSGTFFDGTLYQLKRGDTPSKLVKKYGLTIGSLNTANPNTTWKAGTNIILPFVQQVQAGEGDSIAKIGSSFGVGIHKMTKLNDTDETVRVGDKVVVPAQIEKGALDRQLDLKNELNNGKLAAIPDADKKRVLLAETSNDGEPNPTLIVDKMGEEYFVREVVGVSQDATVLPGAIVSIQKDPDWTTVIHNAIRHENKCDGCPKLPERAEMLVNMEGNVPLVNKQE